MHETRYKSKLKQRLKGYFKDSNSFLPSTNKNIAEVVANTDCATGTFFVDEESQIRATAKTLKEDILNKYGELQDINWRTNFIGTAGRFTNAFQMPLYFSRNVNKI